MNAKKYQSNRLERGENEWVILINLTDKNISFGNDETLNPFESKTLSNNGIKKYLLLDDSKMPWNKIHGHIIIGYQQKHELKLIRVFIDAPPPSGEARFQLLNLAQTKSPISVRARYGDELTSALPYESILEPMLLFAPMDLPMDLYDQNKQLLVNWEGYSTKPDSFFLVMVTDYLKPLFVYEHIY